MYAACSTTAQRGALDWYKPFHDATKPVFEKLYKSVAAGIETKRSLEKNSSPTYREELEEELREIRYKKKSLRIYYYICNNNNFF